MNHSRRGESGFFNRRVPLRVRGLSEFVGLCDVVGHGDGGAVLAGADLGLLGEAAYQGQASSAWMGPVRWWLPAAVVGHGDGDGVVCWVSVGVKVEQAADAAAVGVFDDVGHGFVGGERQVIDGVGCQANADGPVVDGATQLVESWGDGRHANPEFLNLTVAVRCRVHD